MGTVIAYRIDATILKSLEANGNALKDDSIEAFDEIGEFFSRIEDQPETVDVILLGPGIESIEIALRIKSGSMASREFAVLVLWDPEHLKPLGEGILDSPVIGTRIDVSLAGDEEYLARTVREAIEKTRQRQGYRNMISEAQYQVATLTPPQPKSAQLLNSILDNAPIGVVVLDATGTILDLNREARTILELENREWLGSPLIEQFPDEVSFRFDTCPDSGEGRVEVLQRKNKDGKVLFIEARISDIPGRGDDRFLMVILRDVTEQKRLESERLQFTQILEQRVSDRTSELASTNEALKLSNQDLEQFAYVASHDLKSPLRRITSFAELLQINSAGKLDPELVGYVDRIVKGTGKMQKMIDDLLEYAKVQSTSTPESTSVNLGQICDTVVDTLQSNIQETKAVVTRDELPVVSGDPSELSKVIQYLIENSLKYSGEKPPEIHISAGSKREGVTVSVCDQGIGVDPEYHQLIFEIFRRLHTEKEYPGTGIGLAICRRIINRHGGKIWLESKKGAGSRFYFTLPEGESNIDNDSRV